MAYEAQLAETVLMRGHRGDRIDAYLARPLGGGPYPGVVVIHHMPGWDEWSKEVTRKLAYHGYAARSHDHVGFAVRHQRGSSIDSRIEHARHHVIGSTCRDNGLVNQLDRLHAAHFGAWMGIDHRCIAGGHHADRVVEDHR